MGEILLAWAYASGRCEEMLTREEAARVERLTKERERRLQATSYALRRAILSSECGIPPHEVRYETTCRICGSSAHGRPRLSGERTADIEFNVSHSGGIAAVAVTRAAAIGLDLEDDDKVVQAWPDIADSVLHPSDDASLNRVQIWTAKEAFLKLTGHGLGLPMTSIALARRTNGDGAVRLAHAGTIHTAQIRWLKLDARHTAAIAAHAVCDVSVSQIDLDA